MCWRWRRHMPRSSETVARSDRWRSSAPWRSRAAPGSCPRLRRMDRFDHHAGARLRRMDRFGLARLSDRRDCQSPAYGRRPDLCSPLRPVDARWLAGEDDLDAPDLCDGPRSQTSLADEHPLMPNHGEPRVPPRKPGNGQRRNSMHGERPAPLEPEQSAALREKLLTELGTITSADLAAIWAQEALTTKNGLTAADAKRVEDAFEHRLSELAPSATAEAADDAAPRTDVDLVGARAMLTKESGDLDPPDGIDKSGLVLATPRRYRNREHLRYVAQQLCLICGRKQSDPHHLRYLQPRALGRKASDEF